MRKGMPWTNAGSEPSLADLLADPVAQALMRADGVTAADVISAIGGPKRRATRARLDRPIRPEPAPAR